MRLKIHHTTRYVFEAPVAYGLQQLRKTPKTWPEQQIISWSTEISGGRKELTFDDHHRNTVELINIDKNATELSLTSFGEVDLTDTAGVVGRHRGPAPLWLYLRQTERTKPGTGVRELVRGVGDGTPLERMHALSTAIREAVAYEVGASEAHWTAEDSLSDGHGVCQDHTHILLSCARALGVPARYVSGYLMLDDRTAQDAMHAWAEAHFDGLGWVGFDVSNGISPDTRYVRVATGLDYLDAAPVSGTRIGGAGETLEVAITVAQQ